MTKQEKLDHTTHHNRQFPRLAATAATFLVAVMMGHTAKGYPGDQWILPIDKDHVDIGGYGSTWFSGEGYDGTDAFEGWGADGRRRVYWALNGLSISNTVVPITTEQYTIEWFQTSGESSDWQPIEGNLRGYPGIAGSDALMDPIVPWAGASDQNHQWIGAEGIAGTPGTWTRTGPGPHTPTSTNYNADPGGIYMWLTRGAYLYAKWDFPWSIRHTWSALRLTQVTITRPVFKSVTKSGNTLTLTWSAGGGGNYQVQYKTNLSQVGWINLGDTIPATNLTTSTTDVNPPDARRYYRVQVLP
jgi:hypothetical protein